MQIGPYFIDSPVILAPMAGITDKPFRKLCRTLGAGLAVSEMTLCDPRLRNTRKSSKRSDHLGEAAPVSVQIAGADPGQLADTAKYHIDRGAQIIDINMGCPVKKVCNTWAGSALMRDEVLVEQILRSVTAAAGAVPVTLKIRTGWNRQNRNAMTIARIAEECGITALAVHGRTRDQHYGGQAEYDTIAEIKSRIRIPVIANGDIDSPEKAAWVLRHTDADAVMIGRAAQGRPWIFREVAHFLATGRILPPPSLPEVRDCLLDHLHALYDFYGERQGVRIARKHLGWYTRDYADHRAFRALANSLENAEAQLHHTRHYFDELIEETPGQ
ncbi:MAG: tRNA dihydrouridine synthase DusB [Xanthomonadaceae bacterium]|jgi:tRNA-dihydrouridine synthase B|nr:tRNA dihydrouridine synthase DusB [Xanthomonadaceae bacterium]